MTFRPPALVSVLILTVACQSGPTDPSPEQPALRQIAATAHFVFYAAPGDSIDTSWQEQYYGWLIRALDVAEPPPLQYLKYRDTEHLKALTGRNTSGFAETGSLRFHTIWPIDNHECVHSVVMYRIGHPPPLFNEGVAVAHQTFPDRGRLTPTWNGADLHQIARGYDQTGRVPALGTLLRGSDFFSIDANTTYPVAGSFVRYLLDSYGLTVFKAYVAGSGFEDAPTVIEMRFLSAYGRSLNELWQEWRVWLQTQ